jgi:hypothetical protein
VIYKFFILNATGAVSECIVRRCANDEAALGYALELMGNRTVVEVWGATTFVGIPIRHPRDGNLNLVQTDPLAGSGATGQHFHSAARHACSTAGRVVCRGGDAQPQAHKRRVLHLIARWLDMAARFMREIRPIEFG